MICWTKKASIMTSTGCSIVEVKVPLSVVPRKKAKKQIDRFMLCNTDRHLSLTSLDS